MIAGEASVLKDKPRLRREIKGFHNHDNIGTPASDGGDFGTEDVENQMKPCSGLICFNYSLLSAANSVNFDGVIVFDWA